VARKASTTADRAVLERNLVELLTGGHAHATAEQALDGLPAALRAKRPHASIHSAWEELEHMRLAQADILAYTLDPSWKSPPWPKGFWPRASARVSDERWNESRAGFFEDRERFVKELVTNRALDLTAELPHGEGRTYLRQVLLAADHNAYHIGQIVLARKLLGAWR
jgi:hypothetical protein